jgi:hypothetical protein
MLINEVANTTGSTPEPQQLMGLVSFLAGRAKDQNSQKQIDQQAFIDLARSLGITIAPNQLADLVGQPPLSNVLEPLAPDSQDPILFKGAEQPADVAMPVNKAQDIVASAAKSAMKRGLKK